MRFQVGKRYAIHVIWPYSYRADSVHYLDSDFNEMLTLDQAIAEAKRWKVDSTREDATAVTIFEEVMRLV